MEWRVPIPQDILSHAIPVGFGLWNMPNTNRNISVHRLLPHSGLTVLHRWSYWRSGSVTGSTLSYIPLSAATVGLLSALSMICFTHYFATPFLPCGMAVASQFRFVDHHWQKCPSFFAAYPSFWFITEGNALTNLSPLRS